MTYKLKLNGGDIKAVQGDSGHSQVDMVTDVYSHIIDEDRRRNCVQYLRECGIDCPIYCGVSVHAPEDVKLVKETGVLWIYTGN